MKLVRVLLSFVRVPKLETTKSGRERIVVTEFPYMVNKTKVHEHIVRLAQENVLRGLQQSVTSLLVKGYALSSKCVVMLRPMLS